MTRPLIVANCSGFYGDRALAAKEMVEGGPIDVLTGDWLAELTMLILAKDKQRGGGGYAKTFLRQMRDVLPTCLERGIKVVTNAGGLDPAACAEALRELSGGLDVSIAWVTGDDCMDRIEELRAHDGLRHLDTGEVLGERGALTANAYLGGFGIAEALSRGADVVIAGRVTDAAVILGPAIWHHGWGRDDLDEMAGAVAAGHVIECGPQATGGNFSFFTEIADMTRPGFPIAEIASDGSSVITKHPNTGGAVTTETVTAQLLYEIGPPAYLNPDVTSHFDQLTLTQEAPDRVRISGVVGSAPPATAKVGITVWGGFRSTVTIPLVGLDIEAKADVVLDQIFAQIPGGRGAFREVETELQRTDHVDPATNEHAVAWLRLTVRDDDAELVGKVLQRAMIESTLGSIPGLHAAGEATSAQAYGSFWPTLVPAELFAQDVHVGGEIVRVAPSLPADDAAAPPDAPVHQDGPTPDGPTVRAPLGLVMGARSGDKGGNANLGVWARTDAAHDWLRGFLTVERLQELMPETGSLAVTRHELPNLRALNFVIVGLLGEGVASGPRQDPQAKALGEYLRAKVVDIPASLLPAS